GAHDWYRTGCEWLVRHQNGNGSWTGTGTWDQWPVVSTSFSVLFLAKGRTPVLISKLVHGPRQPISGAPLDTDWNHDRNDLKHLTDYCSKRVFRGIPLAWQTFDIHRGLMHDSVEDVTSELLASPIAYFNGHESPELRFGALAKTQEKDVLKRYIENGG